MKATRIGWLDLAIAAALALAGLIVALLSPPLWLRAAALAPLVVAVPGYALAAALFPPGALERADRFVYSFVFSISAAALGGLALQVVLGLSRDAWLGLLLAITLGGCAVALARRRDAPPADTTGAPAAAWPARALTTTAFLTALAIAAASIAIAARGVHEQQARQVFASLWAVPARVSGGPAPLTVGVWNHYGPAAYRLNVSQRGRRIQSLRINLGPNQHWQRTLAPPLSAATGSLLVTLEHGSRAYRSLELNIGVGR